MAKGKPVDRAGSGWLSLRRLTRPYRRHMVVLAIASFIGAMTEAAFLVLITSTVLTLAGERSSIGPVLGQTLSVQTALAVGAGALVLRFVLNMVTVRITSSLSAKVRRDQRRRLSRAYLGASWAIQANEASGRLQELLTSFVARANGAVTALTLAITAALSLAAFLATGLGVNALATVAVIGVLALLGAVLAPVRGRIRRRSAEAVRNDLDFSRAVAEFGSLGQEMQTFGVKDQFAERINNLILTTAEAQRRVLVLQGSLTPLYTTFAYAAILVGIGALSLVGVADLSTVGAVTLLMLRSLSYGQQLLAVSGTIAAALPSLERLDTALATYDTNQAAGGSVRPSAVTPVGLRNVSFGYGSEQSAVRDIDADVSNGEILGIIGPSGAGKSTLAQLLLGLRDPTSGSIAVGGADLRTVDRGWWTDRVAFVPQDALLLTGTVAENIRFLREGIGDDAIREAARKANILTEVDELPRGFDTHLGERGNQLSGGQRQRLSIARALAGRPELLILDEPTSALDGQSEALIRDAIAALRGQVTIIVIAHRMSTLDMCDRIMVIEQGQLTALDSPETLRASSAFYRRALTVAGIT